MTNEIAKHKNNANDAAMHKNNGQWGCDAKEQLLMTWLTQA